MKAKTIREVVNRVILEAMKGSGNYSYELNDQATLAIKQILREKMPKEKDKTDMRINPNFKDGFNQYHDEMEQVIEEI